MTFSFEKMFDLTGKTAIVTGGAGILGKTTCEALLAHGANVALLDISPDMAQEAAKDLRENLSGNNTVESFACDVSNPSSIKQTLSQVTKTYGVIDILHNNAASKSDNREAFFSPFETYSLAEWQKIMSVNMDGMFLVAQAVGKHMKDNERRGSIIQTSSIYGAMAPDQRIYEGSEYMGRPINSPAVYSASKAGVLGLTKFLASYWAKDGIRVNSISPGGVESGQNETFKKRYSRRIPLGRMAQRHEVVGAVVFLAGDAASYITGQNIMVDGGLSAW